MRDINDSTFIESLVNLVSSFIGTEKVMYMSVPITTGIRYFDWYKNVNYKANTPEYISTHRNEVINKNIEDAEQKIQILRNKTSRAIIDPTKFEWPNWSQEVYKEYWDRILEQYVDTVIFIDGWQYSNGCSFEFLASIKNGIITLDENLKQITLEAGLELIRESKATLEKLNLPVANISSVLNELNAIQVERSLISTISKTTYDSEFSIGTALHFKDVILDELAQVANIAQFISYGPKEGFEQRFLWVNGITPNTKISLLKEAIDLLISRSSENSVNVRSFLPNQPKGHPFVYGLKSTEDVLKTIEKNAELGLYSIINETIDINDGGVSGVALGNIIEFTPKDTPKGVDKPGICCLPRKMALNILHNVYGFIPKLDYPNNVRVEFSIHPMRRGIRMENTIIWELEEFPNLPDRNDIEINWPNNFSKIIGDKAFGLLIAYNLGLSVPRTTVISRTVAPFTFGEDTGISEVWIRTAPVVRTPGKFSTYKGWVDPFKILSDEDPDHTKIASVLSQQAVKPIYSGSLLTDKNNEPLIEGVPGRGDLFMVGQANIGEVPGEITKKITEVFKKASGILGPIEMEWVFDGEKVWVVQLHKSAHISSYGTTIVAGTPESYIEFDVADGLEKLRELISTVQNTNKGIKIIGNVGITSHYGDVLRKSNIPSIIDRK